MRKLKAAITVLLFQFYTALIVIPVVMVFRLIEALFAFPYGGIEGAKQSPDDPVHFSDMVDFYKRLYERAVRKIKELF